MKSSQKIVLSALAASMVAFTGCGGGDSESAPTTPPPAAGVTCLNSTTNVLRGDCEVDLVLDASKVYKLEGKVKVKNGANITIPAGTHFQSAASSYLVVTAGSTITANGTEAAPIIFDGEAGNGVNGTSGEWGGLTILGNAQTNEAGLVYEVDSSDADFAFGSITTENNTESSGSLNYVTIYNSGFAVAENQEVNGLSLAGVGSGTQIENITIYNSGDDGVELWGGTVNLQNISITNAQDDSFDVDNGYTGTVQNLTVVQGPACAALVEMTNSGDANIVRTNVKIENFNLTASANQAKEGGLYFKDADTTGTFINGTVDMSQSLTSVDAALTNGKDTLSVAPTLTGITITKSANQAATASRKGLPLAPTAGTAVLETAFTTGSGNSIN